MIPSNEWDSSSYQRKFSGTLAYTKVGNGPWEWKFVGMIKENNLVYFDPRLSARGQVVCEVQNYEPTYEVEKYPIVQFAYRTILPGVYASSERNHAFLLTKRHQKSYKIGLSDETFNIIHSHTRTQHRPSVDIDLESPLMGHQIVGAFEVFSPKLVRVGSSLVADGNDIGFMEKGKAVLKSKNFVPLVAPFLEGKWQIESF
jgi:hypothetical protein